jgi:hypothetical protein
VNVKALIAKGKALLASAKKAATAAAGVLAIIASQAVVSGSAHTAVEWLLGVATALGVYHAKNA